MFVEFFWILLVSRSRKQHRLLPFLRLGAEPCLLANEAAMVALLDLEADLLRHIARRGGASVLCAMAQTSQQLRAPIIAAGDEMWREFALARFPCLKSLLELVPTSLSFKSIYRKQLAAVSPEPPPSFPDLSTYVFSVELAVPALGWSAAWSAPVTSFTEGWDRICNPQPWTDATRPAWLTEALADLDTPWEQREDGKGLYSMTLSIFATRRRDLSSFRMFHFSGLDQLGICIVENGTICYETEALPEKEGLVNYHDFDGYGHQGPPFPYHEIMPSLHLATGHVDLGISAGMDVEFAKKYFTIGAPWPEVPVD